MSSTTGAVVVVTVCLMWLGVVVDSTRRLRRGEGHLAETTQMVASGLTIVAAVGIGYPPAWAGFPLIAIGCSLAAVGIVRAVRRRAQA